MRGEIETREDYSLGIVLPPSCRGGAYDPRVYIPTKSSHFYFFNQKGGKKDNFNEPYLDLINLSTKTLIKCKLFVICMGKMSPPLGSSKPLKLPEK